MERLLKSKWKWVAANVLVWTVAKPLFLAIKLWGIESTMLDGVEVPAALLFTSVTVTGLIDGLIFGLIDETFDKHYPHAPFPKKILLKWLINLITGLILTITLLPLFYSENVLNDSHVLFETLVAANIVIIGIYIFLITFLLQFSKVAASWVQTYDLRQIFSMRKVGVEEDRIFMFMDMKSSTLHAETIGAQRYSLLIQDCFRDMNKAVEATGAEIYQYVGDEIIFTWKTNELNLRGSLRHYFYIRENLRHRARYYRERYGLVPEFKAGIHHGTVIRTHVGVMRKSLAFHGDTVNTTSRIQSKCNELGRGLLVSSAIIEGIPAQYRAEFEGTYLLRGKQREVSLFSVHELSEHEAVKLISQEIKPGKARFPAFRMWLNVF